LRPTFQVDDVPAHLIKQTVGLRWAGMWVKEAWERARRATDLADWTPSRRTGGAALTVCWGCWITKTCT